MFCGDRPYSSRRASVGLTFEARHAGMKAAARAPAARTIAAAAIQEVLDGYLRPPA